MNTPELAFPPKIPPDLPAVTFSKEEVMMLWQLVSSQGAVVPLAACATGAELFRTVKELATLHGIVVG